jgi:hypothetical protein
MVARGEARPGTGRRETPGTRTQPNARALEGRPIRERNRSPFQGFVVYCDVSQGLRSKTRFTPGYIRPPLRGEDKTSPGSLKPDPELLRVRHVHRRGR